MIVRRKAQIVATAGLAMSPVHTLAGGDVEERDREGYPRPIARNDQTTIWRLTCYLRQRTPMSEPLRRFHRLTERLRFSNQRNRRTDPAMSAASTAMTRLMATRSSVPANTPVVHTPRPSGHSPNPVPPDTRSTRIAAGTATTTTRRARSIPRMMRTRVIVPEYPCCSRC